MNKNIKKLLFVFSLLVILLVAVNFVMAAGLDVGLDQAAGTGLGAANDPRIIVANIIRIVLGFLGILAVGLVIYAGWLWMTAAGEEEKAAKAKKILTGAVIGLIICLVSFAIVSFILSKLMEASEGGGDGSVCDPPCSSGQYCCSGSCSGGPCGGTPPGGGDSFRITYTEPHDQATGVIRNMAVKTFFNYAIGNQVSTSTLDNNFKVEKIASIASTTKAETALATPQIITGTREMINGRLVIQFKDNDNCGDERGTLNCLPEWSKFRVTVNGYSGIVSINGQNLSCSAGSSCQFVFSTGNLLDTNPPQSGLAPSQICKDDGTLKPDANTITGWGKDDVGISALKFSQRKNGEAVDTQVYLVPGTARAYQSYAYKYDTSAMAVGDNYNFNFYAYDMADSVASSSFNTTIKPGHCCNGIKDGNETGVDCGGDCLSCFGGPCNKTEPNSCGAGNSNCSDNLCSTWFCQCQTADGCRCGVKPMIFGVTPLGGFCSNDKNRFCQADTDCLSPGTCNTDTPNGAAGNFVTISGRYFGTDPGKVYFNDNKQASLASGTNANCVNPWQDNQIIAVAPSGAIDGEIKVMDTSNNFDTTGDNRGPQIKDFLVNNISRPGVCLANPDSGFFKDPFNLQGNAFNGASRSVLFGWGLDSVAADSITNWTSTSVDAKVPNLRAGYTSVYAKVNNVSSNSLIFNIKDDAARNPAIDYIEPASGPRGQYITIYGRNFKTYNAQTSSVKFYLSADPQNLINADIDFPQACRNNWWHDAYITVKVPAVNSLGDYKVVVTNNESKTSLPADFTITTGTAGPGLCLLEPNNGPVGWPVTASGERFGSSQGTGFAKYYNNKDGAVRSWADQKVDSNVPNGAASGPFKVINGQGSISNSLPFRVGKCSSSAECETGEECCGSGVYWSGICRASGACNQGSPIGCAFGWTFKTSKRGPGAPCYDGAGNGACDPTRSLCDANSTCDIATCTCKLKDCLAGQEKCVIPNALLGGLTFNCCPPGQCNALTGQCGNCPANKPDQCSVDLQCCSSGGCRDGKCIDAEACSTYGAAQCNNSYFCPNSPGKCSANPGGAVTETGSCDYSCNNFNACKTDLCEYKTALNKCAEKNQTCALPKIVNYTIGNQTATSTANCLAYNNQNRWIMPVTTSCPAGWTNIGGGRCAENNTVCSACGAGFKCTGETVGAANGLCAINQAVCPVGSTCGSNNKCTKGASAICDCCCRIGHSSEDCCAPLTCAGKCGSDITGNTNTYGSCGGCASVGTTQAEHNAACNCSTTNGKFCLIDAANPAGICQDCAQISDAAVCSGQGAGACCVDAKNNNACRAGTAPYGAATNGSPAYNYCAYYECQTANNIGTCGSNPVAFSAWPTYETLTECNNKCGNIALPGTTCASQSTTTPTCDVNICRDLSCLNENGSGPMPPSSCGTCCCNPANDQCAAPLKCQTNKGSCSGNNRGLCCGCSKDSECGDANLVGCGSDTCCQTRPKVISVSPADNAFAVCRNTLIQATFDKPMQINTFNANIIVAGDYGANQCPVGTRYLTAVYKPSLLARTKFWLAKLPLLNKLFTAEARADVLTGNFCAVSGTASGFVTANKQTILEFKLQKSLEANRKYYVIIRGDSDITDAINNGVLSEAGIGLKPVDERTFNSVGFKGKIWSFMTKVSSPSDSGICQVNSVVINPAGYLFTTIVNDQADDDPANASYDTIRDSDKVFRATAYYADKQPVVPIEDVYNWRWDWIIDNKSAVKFKNGENALDNSQIQTLVAQNVKDANTLLHAKNTITQDQANSPSTTGVTTENTAEVYVLLCANPWPPYKDDGSWAPWQEPTNCTVPNSGCSNTNFELYYCRDAGQAGTADDLPAILSDGVVTRGRTADILKEFYFFREGLPDISSINLATTTSEAIKQGGKAGLIWTAIPVPAGQTLDKYQVYYGTKSGNYSQSISFLTPGTSANPALISGLTNGVKYYFVVTAKYKSGAESAYSNQTTSVPADVWPPVTPVLSVTTDNNTPAGTIKLSWPANTDDTAYYKIYYGATSGSLGASVTVNKDKCSAGTCNTSINGLHSDTTYYFSITAVDGYKNESNKSAEVSLTIK